MLFTEFRFFVFFAVVFLIYWQLRSQRKLFLLLVSYGFYAAWDYRFLSLILLSTVADYIAGQKIFVADNLHKRRWLLFSLSLNLGLLAIFKYFNFFAESFVGFAELLGLPVSPVFLDIVLPVGISFYTFQTLSYSLDIYRGNLKPTKSIIDFALFVAFFPQLVAGPIVRAKEFLPQLYESKRLVDVDFRWALSLFLVGFIKKACVADNLAPFVDAFYSDPSGYGALASWAAALAYTVQIYCDFSGYSDMAIAIAGMLGYRLCANFNAPYLAVSIKDFWRRWHISLSTWLRDYLYISLGGNRHGPTRTGINMMLTMVLGGLWHGASWNFVAWGGLHGLALWLHGYWERRFSQHIVLPLTVCVLLTFGFVVFLWVPFRATDFSQTWQVWQQMLGLGSGEFGCGIDCLRTYGVLSIAALLYFLSCSGIFLSLWRNSSGIVYACGYGLLFASAIAVRGMGYQPFIYFQF